MVNVHNCTGPSVSLSAPLPLSPVRGRGRGSWQRGHLPSRYPEPCSSSLRLRSGQPFPCRLPEVASLGLQVEIEALTGWSCSQEGLDESLLGRHLEDAVHLQPGSGHLLLARAVGALRLPALSGRQDP